MGSTQVDGTRLFSTVPSDKGNGHKLEHGKFHTNIRKNLSTLRGTEHWNRLPKDVESPSLEVSKTHLDSFIYNLGGLD